MKPFITLLLLIFISVNVHAQAQLGESLKAYIKEHHYIKLTDTTNYPKSLKPFIGKIQNCVISIRQLYKFDEVYISVGRSDTINSYENGILRRYVDFLVKDIAGLKFYNEDDEKEKIRHPKDTVIGGVRMNTKLSYVGDPSGRGCFIRIFLPDGEIKIFREQ